MTQKISPHKVSKMMALYFNGYSQTDIANKLKIDQSTVSLYVGKFKSISEQQGIKSAGEEFGIMDQVQALHSLAAELKKAQLTVEEAAVGLRMARSLQKLGISQAEYKSVLQACTKMKSDGFLDSAVKLNKLEHDTGMTYEEIVAKAASTHQELQQTKQDLQGIAGKLNATKEELANIEKQKKLASQGLETHMKNVGVDMKRLELVEGLALALKEAGEDNKDLEDYIQRQHLLNEAGITFEVFAEILEKAKPLTAGDGGKGFLKMLDQYGSLTETIIGLNNKVQSLTKEASDLENKAKLKGELEADIIKLQAEKVSLETCVADSLKQKKILEDIQNQVSLLTKKQASLKSENAKLQAHNQQLTDNVQSKKEIVSDLGNLKKKHDAMATAVKEMEARLEREKRRLDITESFIGLVQSAPSSLAELEKFATALPGLVDQAKQGKYSPTLLKAYVLENLTGGALQVLKCKTCGARFSADKPGAYGYQCPCCGSSSQIVTDKEELVLLKEALATVKPRVIMPRIVTKHPKSNPPDGDKSAG
jgi:DNA repair exonuclease SbcCD ATPase subunit